MTGSASPEGARWTAVIADDHPLVREGVRRILGEIGDVEIVEEVENGLEVVRAAKLRAPSLFVLDLAMPYSRGAEVFAEVRRQSPRSRIAILTGMTASAVLAELISVGVDGLFLKHGSPDALARGLRLVLEGGKCISPDVVALLDARPPPPELSHRERQTLSLVAQGFTNAEIGQRLNISPKTVDKHRTSLMAKLGVHSLAELLALALREGLLEPTRQL